MATTPNYGWVTPAPTDFVTDLPADFETFADAVDADLAGLLGGTTGQVLTKDSATDHDFSWQDPAGGGKTYTLLNTGGTALTGAATITVSGISNIEEILVIIEEASSANSGSYIQLRVNNDSGSNYRLAYINNRFPSTYAPANVALSSGFNASIVELGRMGSNAASVVNGYFTITAGKSTGLKPFIYAAGGNAGGGTDQQQFIGAGAYAATASISSISLISSTGNFDNGTVYVYGA